MLLFSLLLPSLVQPAALAVVIATVQPSLPLSPVLVLLAPVAAAEVVLFSLVALVH